MAMFGLFGGSAPKPQTAQPRQRGALYNTADAMLKGWLSYGGRASEAQASRARQQQQAAELDSLIRANVTDPQELMIALSNLGEWSKQRAQRYAPMQVTGGNTVLNSTQGPTYTAPVMGTAGDSFYTQTPDKINITGKRDPSFAERSEADKRAQDAIDAIERRKLELQRIGLSGGQLALARQIHQARLAAGGYGTPGVGVALGSGALPAGEGWE